MRANTRMWSPLDNWPEEGRGERRGPTRGCGVHLTIGRPKLRVGRVFTCRTRHSTIYSRVVRAICLYAKIGQSPVNIGRLSIGLLSAIHLSSSSVNSSPVSRLEQGARTRGRAGGEEQIGENSSCLPLAGVGRTCAAQQPALRSGPPAPARRPQPPPPRPAPPAARRPPCAASRARS